MKLLGLFLILFISIAANLPDSMIARVGVEANYLLAALVAVVITWMAARQNVAVLILIGVLAVGANLPEQTASQLGIERDYLLAILLGIVLLPLVKRLLDLD